jgi:hypothetical protein
VVDIILDPNEPPIRDGAIVELKYLPAYVLVKLERTWASRLEGLDDSVIPVKPRMVRTQITVVDREKSDTNSEKETISHDGGLCIHRLSLTGTDHTYRIGGHCFTSKRNVVAIQPIRSSLSQFRAINHKIASQL